MRHNASEDKNSSGLVPMIVFGLGILFVWSLIVNLIDLLSLGDRVDQMESKVVKLSDENQDLKEKVLEASSAASQERMIRDVLGYAKEGEIILLVETASESSSVEEDLPLENQVEDEPVWKQWWLLLVKTGV